MPSVTFSAFSLSAAASAAKTITDGRSTIAVMQCVAVRANGSEISFSATDLSQGVTLSYLCEGEGDWLLNLDLLDAFARAASKDAAVRLSGDSIATLKVGALSARIGSLAIDDFPQFLDVPKDGWVDFEAGLVNCMSRLAGGCAKDGSYIDQALHLSMKGTTAHVRISHSVAAFLETVEATNAGEFSVLLHHSDVMTMASLFEGRPVSIAVAGGTFWMRTPGITYYTKCVDGTARDISSLQPSAPKYATVDVASFKAAVRAAQSIVNDKLTSVYVNVGGIGNFVGGLNGTDALCVPFESDSATGIATSINAGWLNAALEACATETLDIGFAETCGAVSNPHVQVRAGKFFGIIMPIRGGFHLTQPIIDAYLHGTSHADARAA